MEPLPPGSSQPTEPAVEQATNPPTAPVQPPPSTTPAANHTRLDYFHKGWYPSIQLMLTGLALVVAWRVFGVQNQGLETQQLVLGTQQQVLTVQQQNAALAQEELKNRVQKLDDLIASRDKQRNDLDRTVRIIDVQQQEIERQQALLNQQIKIASVLQQNSKGYSEVIKTIQASQDGSITVLNHAISILSLLQSRKPQVYSANERALLQNFSEIAGIRNQTIIVGMQHTSKYYEDVNKLGDAFEHAVKSNPPEQHAALENETNEKLARLTATFKGALDKELAPLEKQIEKLYDSQTKLLKTIGVSLERVDTTGKPIPK